MAASECEGSRRLTLDASVSAATRQQSAKRTYTSEFGIVRRPKRDTRGSYQTSSPRARSSVAGLASAGGGQAKMALEFGLVWGQVTLRTSLGVAYVDQEQYPEIELDGRERVVLPGVHEILIANGEVELRINDCNRAALRHYSIQHALKPGQTSLVSEEGDMQLDLKQLSAGNWRIDQISLRLPLHLQMRAVKELNTPSVDLELVAPATHMGRKAVPGQFFQIGPDFLRETIRSDSMLKRAVLAVAGLPTCGSRRSRACAQHSSPLGSRTALGATWALQYRWQRLGRRGPCSTDSRAWGDVGPAVQIAELGATWALQYR